VILAAIITLVTDFGIHDPFVGIMKGVIYSLAPHATIVDITHGIESYSVLSGALILDASYRYFPPHTLHVAIVDPEVGSHRRIILAKTEHSLFLAPDNGILSFIFHHEKPQLIVEVNNPQFFLPSVSSTFHGRDIFAPVAAHVAQGKALEEFGPSIDNITLIPAPFLRSEGGKIHGEIIYIDRFGNLITSIPADMVGGIKARGLHLKDQWIPGIFLCYAEGEKGGHPIALVNSFGKLEIAVNQGSAEKTLNAALHDRVEVDYE
jgi:S-adenosyl-L-methionine hydrolase (adenosine-forming)